MLLIANRQMLVFRIQVHTKFVKLSMTEFEKNAFAEFGKGVFYIPLLSGRQQGKLKTFGF